MTRIPLPQVVERLQAHYGQPKMPRLSGPWEMILWENVAYLADDDRRREAFQTLKKRIGTEPEQLLSASDEALLEVTRHGMLADQFANKLRKCAQTALEEFDGDLRHVLKLPFHKAKKARVLLRLGFGEEKKSYSTTYRLVQKAIEEGLDKDYSWLIEAHLLLRHHGQELCKRSKPECRKCPLTSDCEFYQRGDA